MTGHKPFSGFTKDFSSERKARITSLTNQLREEMTLPGAASSPELLRCKFLNPYATRLSVCAQNPTLG